MHHSFAQKLKDWLSQMMDNLSCCVSELKNATNDH